MKQLFILFFIGCFCNAVLAQDITYRERVHIYTDKDCYLSGEDMWVRFLVYDNGHEVSNISKTGYIEIADVSKPYVQLPLALENGAGSVSVRLPQHIPGGVYRLTGYTRFMRNEGEDAFFTKDIVIVNPNRNDNNEELLIIKVDSPDEPVQPPHPAGNLPKFGKRSSAAMQLPSLPDNLIDVNISIAREDITTRLVAETNPKPFNNKPITFVRWMPEYEGHIVNGRIETEERALFSNISIVGNTFCFFTGKPFENRDLVEFYTNSVYGRQDMVMTLNSIYHDSLVQAKPEILSPFAAITPGILAPAEITISEQPFMERSIAVQLQPKAADKRSYVDPDMYSHSHFSSYNMDEYNQFPTLEESIFEFVHQVRVSTINDKKRIRVFMLDEDAFNNGNTLVLLDGIPIFDHEQALAYNPRFIQYLNVYNGNYVFGGRIFRAIVSLITYENTLPHFILNELSGLLEYTFPLLPEAFTMPDYSDTTQKESPLPDFRTTLYWQPYNTEGMMQEISFYTSDLAGRYRVAIEGVTDSGRIYRQSLYFEVE